MSIRLGVVNYLNTKPLVYALERNLIPHRFELIYDVPSACASLLARGELDLAIIPSIEYARSEVYHIVPDVSIACDGPVKSALLISSVNIDQIRSVALDTSSRSSTALSRILMQRVHGFTGEFINHSPDLGAMLKVADGAVLIGDRALDIEQSNLRIWDLGEMWRKNTGLPFVFAIWAGVPGVLTPEDVSALVEAKRIGLGFADEISKTFGEDHRGSAAFYESYLKKHILYELGERETEGLRTFYRHAASLEIIPNEPEIRFYDRSK